MIVTMLLTDTKSEFVPIRFEFAANYYSISVPIYPAAPTVQVPGSGGTCAGRRSDFNNSGIFRAKAYVD